MSLDITPEEFRDFLEQEWIFQKQVNPLLQTISFDDYLSGVYSQTESLLAAKAPYRLWFQLYNTREELQQTQANLERSQTQLQQTQLQLQQAQDTIRGMESSKFWQLRQGWFRLKQNLGLKGDD